MMYEIITNSNNKWILLLPLLHHTNKTCSHRRRYETISIVLLALRLRFFFAFSGAQRIETDRQTECECESERRRKTHSANEVNVYIDIIIWSNDKLNSPCLYSSVCFVLFIFAWQIENSAPFHFRYDDLANERSIKKCAVGNRNRKTEIMNGNVLHLIRIKIRISLCLYRNLCTRT